VHPQPRLLPITHLVEPRERGRARGYCVVCGTYTEEGIPLTRLPKTFTDWYRLGSGSVVCPHCYTFIKNPDVRRRPWLLVPGELRTMQSRKQVHSVIADPPQPPYAIYIPIAGKKHGWIQIVHRGLNTSREIITVGTEAFTVTFRRKHYLDLHAAVKELLEAGARKSWISSPVPSPRLYTVAPRNLVDKVLAWHGTNLLRLVLLTA